MSSTGTEGDPLVDEQAPEVGAGREVAEEDASASFLHAVQRMVHGEPLSADHAASVPAVSAPAAEGDPDAWLPGSWLPDEPSSRGTRRADKATRRHEVKLAKTERRSARKSRKSRTSAPDVEAVVVTAADERPEVLDMPLKPQRVPAQAAAEPALEDVGDPDTEVAAAQAEAATSRQARRRDRREAVRAAAVLDDEPPLEPALAESAASTGAEPVRRTRASRRDRRRDAARAVAASVLVAAEPEPVAPSPAGSGPGASSGSTPEVPPSRRARRRERRESTALAKAVARGESPDPRVESETLAEYLGRVESQRLPRRSRRSRPRTPLWFRRTVKISAVIVVIAAVAVLPWAEPRVPDAIAGLVPGHGGTAVHVKDPTVAPPTDAVVGPVGVSQQAGPYDGVRLEAAGWPREVVVPRLHVDSDVVPISGQSGSLLPPSDPQILGWWREGRPVGAQYGTAVVTGHTVHTGGGALDHLDKLVVGDSLRVRTDAGWIRYVVQRTRVYSTDELAQDAENIFRLGGSGRLVMITCDDWNGHAYESNAVVVAVPVLDEPFSS